MGKLDQGNFEEVFARIKSATNTRTQVELAEVLDIRQSSISDAKRRNSIPADWYMKLFELFGLNPDWMKRGSGPMYLRTDQGYSPVDAPAPGMYEDAPLNGGRDAKSTVVPVYSTQAAPDAEKAVVLGRLNIPQSFAGEGIYVLRVDSAAMEPVIRRDAFVGIDASQRHVASGELYCVRVPHEGAVLKRIYVDAQNNRLVLRSENSAHPEAAIPIEGHEDHVIGRVIWLLQRM